MADATLKSPFPYFGGKSKVAPIVWQLLGDVPNYVEPFCGSAAVLLARPAEHQAHIETVNDADGMIANFWRALSHAPNDVAQYADWPVNENDLHARHAWLVGQRESITARLEGDPEWFDAKVAGWWVWGMALWIGGGFCSGEGPWHVVDGKLVHLWHKGQGVNRQLVHLWHKGQGVNRQRVHLWHKGQGVNRKLVHLQSYFNALAERLRDVRVCCGDWSRVCGPTPTVSNGLTGVFLDPPYAYDTGRDPDCYTVDSANVANAVRAWCLERGNDSRMRIVLAGYDGEHNDLEREGWRVVAWSGHGGYAGQRRYGVNTNRHKERLWASPHCQCLAQRQMEFGE
jgi:DNA adenine methylase